MAEQELRPFELKSTEALALVSVGCPLRAGLRPTKTADEDKTLAMDTDVDREAILRLIEVVKQL